MRGLIQSLCLENDKFSREVSDILQRFTTATEWADLSNLLERLKKSIANYPDSRVPKKKELAKRLSQCLTPELQMIHMQTLDIYVEVFKRELVSLSATLLNQLLLVGN